MPHYLLRCHRARPSADQGEKMQLRFRYSPRPFPGGILIDRINNIGHKTRNTIDRDEQE
jgi:hypothetical protein